MNLQTKRKMYIKLHNYSYEEATEKVFEEAQNQLTHLDEKLSLCIEHLSREDVLKLFPQEQSTQGETRD